MKKVCFFFEEKKGEMVPIWYEEKDKVGAVLRSWLESVYVCRGVQGQEVRRDWGTHRRDDNGRIHWDLPG